MHCILFAMEISTRIYVHNTKTINMHGMIIYIVATQFNIWCILDMIISINIDIGMYYWFTARCLIIYGARKLTFMSSKSTAMCIKFDFVIAMIHLIWKFTYVSNRYFSILYDESIDFIDIYQLKMNIYINYDDIKWIIQSETIIQ